MIETHYAGITLDFPDDVPEYPPSAGWTLKYRLAAQFTTPTQASIELEATADGERYRVQAAADVTATWAPGKYSWARWVEKAGPIRHPLGQGTLTILPRIDTLAQGYDNRTHARKILDDIEAALESRSLAQGRAVLSYTIGSRSQTFDASETRAALLEMRSKYKWLVADEDAGAKIAAGLPNPRDVRIRFGRA